MRRYQAATRGLIFTASLLLSAPLQADDLARFQLYREITLSADGVAELGLDAAVMGNAREDLSDLRLLDGSGAAVSFTLTIDKDKEVVLERSAEVERVECAEADSVQTMICDLGESPGLHNRVVLETAAGSFRGLVDVATSQDQEEWIVARVGAVIYDVPPNARTTAVDYPENGSRYLRVLIHDHRGRSLNFSGVRVQHRAFRPASRHEMPGTIIERFDDTLKGVSRFTLDLGHERAVSDQLILDFGKRINFASEVTVEGSRVPGQWHAVGAGALFAFDEPNLSVRSHTVGFTEAHDRYLLVSVGHGGQEALEFGRVIVGSCRRILHFEGPTGGRYRLYYGNPAADVPAFRISEAPPDEASAAALGPVTVNPDWRDPETERRIGLYAGMAAVGLVALLAIRFRRRTVRIVEEEEELPVRRGDIS